MIFLGVIVYISENALKEDKNICLAIFPSQMLQAETMAVVLFFLHWEGAMGATERCMHPYNMDVKRFVSILEKVEFAERKHKKQSNKDNDELVERRHGKLMS